ncbi:hypothetical protein ACFS07_09705 [Undibacterium arcticum]
MTPITRRPEPTAQLDPGALFHIAFYKFVELNDPDAVVARLRELTRHLLGSILVATEGINGVLAGTAAALDAFQQALLIDPCFDHRFAGIVFKRSACITKPFGRIKVHKKKTKSSRSASMASARLTPATIPAPMSARRSGAG